MNTTLNISRPAGALAAALATAGLAAATSAPAQADTLYVPSPGATNLTTGGGYQAWATPTAAGFRLLVRAPDGAVSMPDLPGFSRAPDPSIGAGRPTSDDPGTRPLLLAYSRCADESTITDCDVYSYDLRAGGAEQRIPTLSTETYSETAPSVAGGRWSFVRRGNGPRKGVHAWTGAADSAVRRLSPQLARETQSNGSRVAFNYNSSRGGGVALRRLSGRGATVTLTAREDTVPSSLAITRYRAGWLLPADGGVRATSTTRFGSGEPDDVSLEPANRLLPATTSSIATDGSRYRFFTDEQGLKTIDPKIFRAG